MANETLNTAMGSISGIVAFLGFCGAVWKYLKSKFEFEEKLAEFNRCKERLQGLRVTTETTVRIQLRGPGNVVRQDVQNWLDAADVEISQRQSVEYLVKQKGILSLYYRTGIVMTRTAELNRTFENGELLIRQLPRLVDNDASLERFTEQKEKLEVKLRDVEVRLRTQLLVPRKIETEEVKLWREKVEEITGQTATDIETNFNGRVPQEPEFPNLVKQKIREMEELIDEGARPPGSLVEDDYSQTLGVKEIQSFEEWKDKLQVKHRDVKDKLSTELLDPEKIATEQVEEWLHKVEGIIFPDASDVDSQLNSRGAPYIAPLVSRVKKLIQKMKELCSEGDQLLTENLVDDDYSLTLSGDDRKTFAHYKDKLWGKCQDVERISQLQLRPRMIETEQVKIWKKQVAETTASAVGVQNQLDREPPYTAPLVRRVKNLIQEMEKLHDDGCKLPDSLVIPDPSASAPLMLVPELQGSASDAVKEEILEHLMGDETAKIGVWGMAGIGKTTIMMHVYSQLLKEPKFKKVVWVTVSETFDICKIQQEIASSLQKDEILPNQQGGDLRAAAAISKMLEEHKPYVLILDDVWESFELHKVGIPEIPGCKLVLTTRSEEVIRTMDCKPVKVNMLSLEDSLKLFKDTAGVVEALPDDGGLEGILQEMVGECGGLPLTIKVVAASMKGISDPRLWRDALTQLKQGSSRV